METKTEYATAMLFSAARTGDVAKARAALDAKADVTATTTGNLTPLHVAAYNGDAHLAKLLLENGADVNAKTLEQQTPLHFAARNGTWSTVGLLLARGADVNASESVSGETPLQAATRFGRDDIVVLLENAAKKQEGHAGRIIDERKDKGPPQVGG